MDNFGDLRICLPKGYKEVAQERDPVKLFREYSGENVISDTESRRDFRSSEATVTSGVLIITIGHV